jgi:hypothetical protein
VHHGPFGIRTFMYRTGRGSPAGQPARGPWACPTPAPRSAKLTVCRKVAEDGPLFSGPSQTRLTLHAMAHSVTAQEPSDDEHEDPAGVIRRRAAAGTAAGGAAAGCRARDRVPRPRRVGGSVRGGAGNAGGAAGGGAGAAGPVLARPVRAGGARSFGPRYVHDVRNAAVATVAVSVHAYSRSLPVMTSYELTPAGLVRRDTEAVWAVLFGALFAWEGLALSHLSGAVPTLSDTFRVIRRGGGRCSRCGCDSAGTFSSGAGTSCSGHDWRGRAGAGTG